MNKQIEEMAECLIEIQRNFNEYCAKPCRDCELGGVVNCENYYKAEALYNAGYRKTENLAREIFEEIENIINNELQNNCKVLPQFEFSNELWNRMSGRIEALKEICDFIAELKKKYESEGADDD